MDLITSARRSPLGKGRALIAGVLAIAAFAGIAGSAQASSLTITRHTDPANDPTPVTYHVDFMPHPGTSNGPGNIPADFQLVGGETKTFNVNKGFFTITEQTPSGWKLVSIGDCFTDDPDPKDKTVIDLGRSQALIELSDDEHKGCTFTDRKQPVLTIVKRTDPAGGAGTFTFQPDSAIGAAPFNLGDGQSQSFTLDPGTYQVTEAAVDGWMLRSIACDDTDSAGSGATVTAVLSAGEVVTCTFTNAAVVPVQPNTAQNAPVASPPPAVAVAPTRARRGTARLLAPTRCVSNRFTVAVRGSAVRSITWSVNGRRVKTTRAKKGQRRFTIVLRPGAIQRVTARVTFVSDASPRTRTLRKTIRRCSPSSVNPRFTG